MKSVKLSLLLALVSVITMAQKEPKIPLIGKTTPTFQTQYVQGIPNFDEDFGTHRKLIESNPPEYSTFRFSELLELACDQNKLNTINVDILILSTDPIVADFTRKDELINKKRVSVKCWIPVHNQHAPIKTKTGTTSVIQRAGFISALKTHDV